MFKTPGLLRTYEKYKWHILFALGISITFYLFWDTGIHGDDYSLIREVLAIIGTRTIPIILSSL